MPQIKFQHVNSFSSEDKNFPAENLLDGDSFKKWKCNKGEKNATVTFQLAKAEQIHEVHIGNEGSAFIEVLVGRSGIKEEDFKVLIVTSSFMSPVESRNGQNTTRVRLFGPDKLASPVKDEKWDKVKVVCTQPFNKVLQYGLSFFKLHSPPDLSEKTDTSTKQKEDLGAFVMRAEPSSSDIKAGSLFASRHKEKAEQLPLSGAAAVRAASKLAEEMTSKTNSSTSKKTATAAAGDAGPSAVKQVPSESKPIKMTEPVRKRPKSPEEAPKPAKLQRQSTSQSSSSSTDSQKRKPSVKKDHSEGKEAGTLSDPPFHKIMQKVTFVISGYQNPQRGEMRDKALEMGAKYRQDWGKGCTHLVCAYDNTPKYNQVKGKGRIVKAAWVDDCYKKKMLLPWRKYRVGRAKSPPTTSESEDEQPATFRRNNTQVTKAPAKKTATPQKDDLYRGSTDVDSSEDDSVRNKTRKDSPPVSLNRVTSFVPVPSTSKSESVIVKSVYDESTDDEPDENLDSVPPQQGDEDDMDNDDDELPQLPDFFSSKHFFLFGDFDRTNRRRLVRFIVAYNGHVDEYMSEKTSYVITNSTWSSAFDDALSDNPDLVFVKPDWVVACDEHQKRLAHQKFIVVPS